MSSRLGLEALLWLRHRPWFLQSWYRREEHALKAKRVVRPTDELVIDGYPRSANTFATHAIFLSQGEDIRIGNHMHNPAQFVLAARYAVPAMLLLRNPVDACASHMLQRGWRDPADALLRYIAFHRDLPEREHFVVAPFEEVTTDFNKCIDRLNARFGTAFAPFEHSDASRDEVFEHMTSASAERIRHFGEGHHTELGKSLPTNEKKALGAEIKVLFDRRSTRALRLVAEKLYSRLRS